MCGTSEIKCEIVRTESVDKRAALSSAVQPVAVETSRGCHDESESALNVTAEVDSHAVSHLRLAAACTRFRITICSLARSLTRSFRVALLRTTLAPSVL